MRTYYPTNGEIFNLNLAVSTSLILDVRIGQKLCPTKVNEIAEVMEMPKERVCQICNQDMKRMTMR